MILDSAFLSAALPDSFVFLNSKRYALKDADSLFSGKKVDSISIDSRDFTKGQAFLALTGESVDAHDFLDNVIASGADVVIIKESELFRVEDKKNILVLVVPDTLQALINLAKVWRKHFSYPVVAVTGSIGKTTTKEMIYTILSTVSYKACVSYKNQNTLIGLCLNILKMRDEHQVAVFEVGISLQGEMIPKVDILRPTIGVITMVAHSHMEGLGTLKEIAEKKKEVFSFFKEDSIGIVFGDQKLLHCYYNHPVIYFGFKTKNRVQARKVSIVEDGICFSLKMYRERHRVCLKTIHQGYVHNALAAAAVANILGISLQKIVAGLEAYEPFEGRFERKTLANGKGVIINDCYNANPESMRAALLAVDAVSTKHEKVAVLGDMLGMGTKELYWHRQVGRVLVKTESIQSLLLVGERAKSIAKTAPSTLSIEYAADWKEASAILEEKLHKKSLFILVKASHDMRLEKLVQKISL